MHVRTGVRVKHFSFHATFLFHCLWLHAHVHISPHSLALATLCLSASIGSPATILEGHHQVPGGHAEARFVNLQPAVYYAAARLDFPRWRWCTTRLRGAEVLHASAARASGVLCLVSLRGAYSVAMGMLPFACCAYISRCGRCRYAGKPARYCSCRE